MAEPVQSPEESSVADYAVGVAPASRPPSTRYALFFTHGMGQTLPFQTIDQVANSLRELDLKLGHKNPKPVGRTVKSGEDWLNRIELRLKSGAEAVEVHLYEGYWAPMTEGRITARNVIGFLAGAGFNGLRHTKGKFRRWLFGKFPELPIPVRMIFYLITALATVAGLVVMNSTIAIVAAARALLGQRPPWLSDNLFADLTTTFNIVVAVMGLFGVSLAIAALMRNVESLRRTRKPWSAVTLVLFVMALFVVILSGVAIPLLFYGHARGLTGESRLWDRAVGPALVDSFNGVFDAVIWWLALALAAFVVSRWIWRIVTGLKRDLEIPEEREKAQSEAALEHRKTTLRTAAIALAFLLLFGAAAWLAVSLIRIFAANSPGGAPVAEGAASWVLLVAASAYIRLVLVQFVGDVAIYVMPYKLDAFNDLRREIKLRVYTAAKAVYAQMEYNSVIVVGHSLGSVIAYDALNMLILEDESVRTTRAGKAGKAAADRAGRKAAEGKAASKFLDVVKRTPLFLTFGSPLDKTAFVFAAQAHGTSEAREALAGSVQPLIQDYGLRPKRWINVWSPWDIISGPLDLYDLPRELHDFQGGTVAQRVHNVRDREATTLLMAHVEYWKNPLVVGTIYDEIKAAKAARAARGRQGRQGR